MQICWFMGVTVPEVLMMAKNTLTVQTKTRSLIYFQTKFKKTEESKQGEQLKLLLK